MLPVFLEEGVDPRRFDARPGVFHRKSEVDDGVGLLLLLLLLLLLMLVVVVVVLLLRPCRG